MSSSGLSSRCSCGTWRPSGTAIWGELVELSLLVSFGVSFVVGHRFEVGLGADGLDLGGELGEEVGDLVEAVAVLAFELA
jgi:hypothetical protein